ncbi:MAG TPA: zinc-binding alcohol dehydrogenase family protein [Acidobacteriaceae bacterium]|jgi:NADPH2:quinone reductase|nr:zinc-binding alcohol dehydrogenase family protein [Acidobacteriaceae bacterium]
MKAAVVSSFDTPPQYADFADPTPQAGELLVHVHASALAPVVRSLAAGKHYGSKAQFPLIAGIDGTGTLEDGSRVYFAATRPPCGAMAERTLTTTDRILRLPEHLDEATVAALMNPGMSSAGALSERAHFQRGESVLIQGATGTAGRLAVQICRRRGASRVVATGRDQQALEELRALGADAVIPLNQDRPALVSAFRDALNENKIDVILDYLWGAPAEALLDAIAQKGLEHQSRRIRFVQIGSAAGLTITLPGATLRSSGLELLGSGFGSVSIEKIFAALAAFLEEAGREPFKVNFQTAPLADVEKLWNQKTDARLVFQP